MCVCVCVTIRHLMPGLQPDNTLNLFCRVETRYTSRRNISYVSDTNGHIQRKQINPLKHETHLQKVHREMMVQLLDVGGEAGQKKGKKTKEIALLQLGLLIFFSSIFLSASYSILLDHCSNILIHSLPFSSLPLSHLFSSSLLPSLFSSSLLGGRYDVALREDHRALLHHCFDCSLSDIGLH